MGYFKELLSKFRNFKCEKLDSHSCKKEGYDGMMNVGHCKYCGKRCLQDSQGNWFAFDPDLIGKKE